MGEPAWRKLGGPKSQRVSGPSQLVSVQSHLVSVQSQGDVVGVEAQSHLSQLSHDYFLW